MNEVLLVQRNQGVKEAGIGLAGPTPRTGVTLEGTAEGQDKEGPPGTLELKSWWSVFQDIDLIDILWRQDIDLGAGREVFDYSHRQKEQDVDKELRDGGEQADTWAGEGAEALARDLLVDGETGESFPAQVPLPLLTGLTSPYTPKIHQADILPETSP